MYHPLHKPRHKPLYEQRGITRASLGLSAGIIIAVVYAIVMDTGAGLVAGQWHARPQVLENLLDSLSAFAARSAKPFLTILQPFDREAELLSVREKFRARGIPTFPTHDRAARAMHLVTRYHRFHASHAQAERTWTKKDRKMR